jgi:hypothetical protein
MIRSFVDCVNSEENTEVERLTDGIRWAIAALQTFVGS